jgi:hypothetical protein
MQSIASEDETIDHIRASLPSHVRLGDLLAEEDAEFFKHDIQPVYVRRIGQHLFQFCHAKEVLSAWANIMRIACRSVGKGLKNSECCVGKPDAKPRTGTRFRLHTGTNVPQERLSPLP